MAALSNLTRLFSTPRIRRVLLASVRVELQTRFSASVLGPLWVILNPLIFLGLYMFLYMVVLKVRFEGFSSLDYVIYVFSGLVPFLCLSETVNTSTTVLRSNLHLIRNVILPIEILPVRLVLVGLASEVIGLAMVGGLTAYNGALGPQLGFVLLGLALQFLFILGLVLTVSVISAVIPDVGYLVNFGLLFLMFISPIGFRVDMVPESLAWVVRLNPIYYMMLPFREAFVLAETINMASNLVTLGVSFGSYIAGAWFFDRFKRAVIDHG